MSVFTTVTLVQLAEYLQTYNLATLKSFTGITSGITNTNYLIATSAERYVLTLFEHHHQDELSYFVNLMHTYRAAGLPCPTPIADRHGQCVQVLNNKPALLVSFLAGQDVMETQVSQCRALGLVLARMHLQSQVFERQHGVRNNQRGHAWCMLTAQQLKPYLPAVQQQLLDRALEGLQSLPMASLPQGVIHGDLFRDNVLFEGDEITGIIDIYYACHDALAFDLAIIVNDWCLERNGHINTHKLAALLNAYQSLRPLTIAEHGAWNGLLQLAALRFWLSRLLDKIFPPDGELTYSKDPEHFYRICTLRLEHPL